MSYDVEVNLERSLKFGDEVGGHLLSGHVSCACNASLNKKEGEIEIVVDKPQDWGDYIIPKGYEETADEKIPKEKTLAQLLVTTTQLKKVIERKKNGKNNKKIVWKENGENF